MSASIATKLLVLLFVMSTYPTLAWSALFGAISPADGDSLSAAKAAEKWTPKSSATTDISDLWWIPTESGWGVQLVQNNDFVFATLFVYGADGKPTWFTATLNGVGGFTWSGPLYATTGPWFARSPFDPSQVGVRQAGSMSFHATDIANGTLTYSVDGTSVTKNITRQTLVNETIAGSYDLVVHKNQVCSPSAGGTATGSARVLFNLTQIGNAVVGISGGCTFNGTYNQTGKMGNMAGTFSCTSGEAGVFGMSEIVITEMGIMLRLNEQSNFCSSIAVQAAGIRQ
jgi:hypothetical protein